MHPHRQTSTKHSVLDIITMKPPSPLSLLLFIHLTCAAPIPSLPSDCHRFRVCRDALADISKPGNPPTDQYLAPTDTARAVDAPIPSIIQPVKEPHAPLYTESLVDSTTKLPTEDRDESSRYARLTAPIHGDKHVLSWCRQMSRDAWRHSREYSELLVVSIVILFLIALTAWEAAGRSGRL